jgi:transposase-like protein
MENAANWRTESRTVYSSDFKLRMVELASRPDANVAQLAREHGVDNNLIFKWLRLWQREANLSSNACNYRGAGGTSISSGFSDSVVRRRYQRPVARSRE